MVDISDRFVRETEGQLRTLSSHLLDLEETAAAERRASVQVDEPFRIAHSLKGRFATEGLEEASDLAHAIEDVLDAVGDGRLEPTATVVDDALSAVDACQTLLEEHQAAGGPRTDVAQIRERLQARVDSVESEVDDDVASATGRDGENAGSERFAPSDLSEDVQEALDDAAEFDDLDRTLEELDADEDDGSWSVDDELDLWEVFEDSSDETDQESPDDASESQGMTSAEAADGSRQTVEDVESGGPSSGEEPSPADSDAEDAVDESGVSDASDGFDEFISFKEMDEAEVDDEEDIEALQADIETEAFGEFDEDDDMSIEELLDIESVGGATSTPADPDTDSSVMDDLRTFDEMREGVDPTVEDLEGLQGDIETEAFGEFDEDDDMSIEELLEADPSELDPEADLEAGSRSIDDEVDSDSSTPADDEIEDEPALGIGRGDDTDPAGNETKEPTAADDYDRGSVNPASETTDREAEASATDVSAPDETGEVGGVESDETSREDDDRTVSPPDSDQGDAACEDESAGDDPASSSDGTPASQSDGPTDDPDAFGADPERGAAPDADDAATSGTDPGTTTGRDTDPGPTGDDAFDLASEEPFDAPVSRGAGRDGVEETELPEGELPEIGEPEFDDSAIGDATFPASGSDVPDDAENDADAIGEDFAFGFGHEETYLDNIEFDSLFARYFSEDGVLFGGDSTGAAEAAATIEETRLDDERFGTAAGPKWQDTNGPGIGDDSIQSLTVGVDNADELLRLAEELGNAQRRLERAVETGDIGAVEEIVTSMRPYTVDLHRSVMSMRLMPLETVFSRLPRVVRDVAGERDKEVDFTVDGEGVRLDRDIIERLEDPLIHLVRNAVDHGIESPTERENQGKPRDGTIELRASRSRGQVVIELSDDGRGIDHETVREAAVENGLLTEHEARTMTREEVLDLVFRPRFSTRREVTDVSGRGVGMDAVRETVRDLTGSVELESTLGEGTTVRLTLPVTVAVSQVLFVYAGGEQFALPASAIESVELAGEPATFDGAVSGASSGDAGQPSTIDALTVDHGITQPAVEEDDVTVTGRPEVEAGAEAGGDAKAEETDEYETIRLADAMRVDGVDDPDPSTGGREKIVRIREEIRPLELRCEAVGNLEEVVIRPFEDVLGGTPGISGTTTDDGEDILPVLDVRSLEP